MTASRKKLALSSEASTIQPSASTSEDGARFGPCDSDYHLIRMSSLKTAVSVFSCCGSPLTVTEERKSRRGLVSKVSICCTVCGKKSLVTDPYREEDLAVNSRSILGMRVIGKGRASLESFTGIMGMFPPPPPPPPHSPSHIFPATLKQFTWLLQQRKRTSFLLLCRTCASLPRMMRSLTSMVQAWPPRDLRCCCYCCLGTGPGY